VSECPDVKKITNDDGITRSSTTGQLISKKVSKSVIKAQLTQVTLRRGPKMTRVDRLN